jgi:uncharacterized SAM-binding protein YcdF (DUF218 family)
MMIPHHQGAIQMARIELADGAGRGDHRGPISRDHGDELLAAALVWRTVPRGRCSAGARSSGVALGNGGYGALIRAGRPRRS